MGWSQGGQAAVWAAQLADTVSAVKRVGAVALAPVNSLEQSKVFEQMVATGAKLKPMSSVERGTAWYAMTVAFPELKLSDVFTPGGVDFYAQTIKRVSAIITWATPTLFWEGYRGPIVREDLLNQDAWRRREALGVVAAKTPVAVFQGDEDAAVTPAATEAYVKEACSAGAVIAYKAYKGVDHIRLASNAHPISSRGSRAVSPGRRLRRPADNSGRARGGRDRTEGRRFSARFAARRPHSAGARSRPLTPLHLAPNLLGDFDEPRQLDPLVGL